MELFDLLCGAECFQASPLSIRDRRTLQKKLQRARKFSLLVTALGHDVLGFEPEVSVTRIDRLKLEELENLGSDSIEGKKFKELLLLMVVNE